jgi:hypothetical protein
VKKAVSIQNTDKEDFNLFWNDKDPPSELQFTWPPQVIFTPKNFRKQLAENNIFLREKWLILDEFICS